VNDRRTVKLGDVLAENRPRIAVERETRYPMLGVFGFARGVILRDEVKGDSISARQLYRVAAGQLIYSRLKAFEGAFALVPEHADGRFVTNEFPTFDADIEVAVPEFISLILGQPSTWEAFAARITGVGARRERLRVPDFLELELELPGVDEQRAIVRAVEAARQVERTARAELDSARELLSAAVEREFVDDADRRDPSKGWRMLELRDVADVRSGITKGRKTKNPLHVVPFIRAANVQSGYLDLTLIKTIEVTTAEIERFRLVAGDVLMIEGGNAEHLGRGWIFEGRAEPCLHQNHVFRARADRSAIAPEFLAYVITGSSARRYCHENAKKTTNLASINKTQISGLPVPVPPLALQREIVARLNAFRAVLVAAGRAVLRNEQLRVALAQSLLNGTLRAPPIDDLEKAA